MTNATAIVEEREADWDVREDYTIVGRNKEFQGVVVEAKDMRMSGLPVLLRSVFLSKKHNTELVGAFALLREASLLTPYIANVYRLVLHKRREGPQLIVASEPPAYGNIAKLINAWVTGSSNAPAPFGDGQVLQAGLSIIDALLSLENIGFSYRNVHPKSIGVNNNTNWKFLLPSLNEFPVPGTKATSRDPAYVPVEFRERDFEELTSEERARCDLYSLGVLLYQLRVWDVWEGADKAQGLTGEALIELNRFRAGPTLRDTLTALLGTHEQEPSLTTFEQAREFLSNAFDLGSAGDRSEGLPDSPNRFSTMLNIGRESRIILDDRDLWDRAAENTQDAVVREIAKDLSEDYKWLRTDRFTSSGLDTRIAIFEHISTGIEMCLIPGGLFVRGIENVEQEKKWLQEKRCDETKTIVMSETPAREILIQPFLLSRYPVLVDQWEKMTKAGTSKDTSGLPVTDVSYDAIVKRLENVSGYLSLPSETEWEYAARAGSKTRFFWGDEMDDKYCWHAKNSSGKVQPPNKHDVVANSFGLVDMLGNVLEWCEDHYVDRYEDGSVDNRPKLLNNPSSDQRRVARGGCVWYGPALCRATARTAIRAPRQKKKSDPTPLSFGALSFRVARPLNA